MEQTESPKWKQAGNRSSAERVLVPLLCIVGVVAVLVLSAFIWTIAVWSAATSG